MYYRWMRPPITRCDVCRRSLYMARRYRVYLVVREGPFRDTVFKKVHVCEECLSRLRADRWLNERFKVRYRKMPPL